MRIVPLYTSVTVHMAYVHTHMLILMFISEYCLAADYRPPRITYPNSSHNFYYEDGVTVNIRCAAEGNPAPTYRWFENDAELRPSMEVRYYHTTGILEIDSFSLRQQTTYGCIATNQYEPLADPNVKISVSTMSPTVRLWKLRLEKFTSQTDIIKNLTEYEYLVLSCIDKKTSATPILQYVWRDTGTGKYLNMDGGRLYISQDGSLHFTYVLRSDSRIAGYRCGISASQSDGFKFDKQGAKYVIYISAATRPRDSGIKPQFKYSNTVVYGTALSAATLECVFGGYGPTGYPKQSWLDIRGKASYVTGNKYTISAYGRLMTIHNLTEDDERFYICSASYDRRLVASSAVFLNVTAPPVFTSGPPTDQVGIQDSSVQFICDARSAAGEVPPSPPIWYVNSKRIETTNGSDKFQLSGDRKVLTVRKLRKHLDVMCVQCQVENHIGIEIASACLDVLLPIQISNQPNAKQKIKYGGLIDLTVNARTDPSMNLSYRWYSPNATYDEGNIPKYMYFNRQSQVAYINTSRMSSDEYKLAEGIYDINIFHQHESRIVRTRVKLLDKSVMAEEGNATAAANDEGAKVFFWVVLSLLWILVASVIIALPMCLKRWKNKPANEEKEAGESVEASRDQPRQGGITDYGSSVDTSETSSEM